MKKERVVNCWVGERFFLTENCAVPLAEVIEAGLVARIGQTQAREAATQFVEDEYRFLVEAAKRGSEAEIQLANLASLTA